MMIFSEGRERSEFEFGELLRSRVEATQHQGDGEIALSLGGHSGLTAVLLSTSRLLSKGHVHSRDRNSVPG